MRKLHAIVIALEIMLILTSCAMAPSDKEYYNIELYMTYSEVVKLIGEPDEISETAPNMPWSVTYYEWEFDDGNKLQIYLEYPGEHVEPLDKTKKHPRYPNDYVVAHCIIINKAFVPETQTTSAPS